jgi:hypothetical protein
MGGVLGLGIIRYVFSHFLCSIVLENHFIVDFFDFRVADAVFFQGSL